MISSDEMKAMKARCEAATEGPWWEDGDQILADKNGMEHDVICEPLGDSSGEAAANAAFISHARSDLPRLIEEVELSALKLDTALDALELILPLAKGYASTNRVGANAEYILHAEAVLAARQALEEKP